MLSDFSFTSYDFFEVTVLVVHMLKLVKLKGIMKNLRILDSK